jgi:PAS domain S-box-containing protein
MSGRRHFLPIETPQATADDGDAGAGVSTAGRPYQAELTRAEPATRRDPMAWALALVGLLIVGETAWWLSGFGDATLSRSLTGAGAVAGGVVATLLAIRIRHTSRIEARTRRAWSIIAIALIGYGVGASIHLGMGPVPALGAIWPVGLALEFATYPLVAAALALLPKPPRSRLDVAVYSLDVAIVVWSAAILLWHFLIFPTAHDAGKGALDTIGVAYFPVWDLGLIFSIAVIVYRGLRESTRAALAVAGVALVFVFLGDVVEGSDQLRGTFSQGGLSGFLYSVAWLGMALAIYLQWRIRDRDRQLLGLADYARSFTWLPYVVVAIAFIAPAIRDWNDIDGLRQHVPASALLVGLIVARLGLTARQNASLAAAEHGRLAAAVDQAAEAILTTDRAGHVTYANLAFERISGISVSEIVGRDPDLLRRVIDERPLAEMSSALLRGENWEGLLALKRRDGTTIDVDMAVGPLREGTGAIAGSVAVARDVSRERALEAQLSQAQRMEAVGRLAGGIAHDFNNILTAISGFGELAAAELPGDHPVASDIEQILKASARAAALTQALLAFSRRQAMQTQLIDLNEVLGGLTPMLGRLIGEDVRLTVRLEPNLWLVRADRSQFEQVVLNLAVNATDAMPDGGTLTIETLNVDLDAAFAQSHLGASDGPYVALRVSDTGVGMIPEVMEHVFEPFFTTKERGKGTGLGLSSAVGVVQQSGGFLSLESKPDAGSVFTVYLPRSEGAALPDETAGYAELAVGGKETILVVEDEDAVRTFVERVLTGAGYRVIAASHGAQALAIATDAAQLDLLFTDVVMPGMSGVELAAALAATHPGLPVIYASGYSEEGVLEGRGGETGVPYLPKPYTAESLLTLVREILDQTMRS